MINAQHKNCLFTYMSMYFFFTFKSAVIWSYPKINSTWTPSAKIIR